MNSFTDLLPLLASIGGNPQYRDAVLQGFLQTRRQFEQEDLLKQQAARQDQMAQAEIANRQADNVRADQLLQLQQQNADLGRLERFRGAAQQQAGTVAEMADDPLAAQNSLAASLVPLAKAYQVPPEAMAGTLPNMAGAISQRKKKRAADLYASAEKRFGPEAMASDSITLTSEEFGAVKPSQLRALFETPAVTDAGTSATPYVKPPAVPSSEKERAAQLLGKIQDEQDPATKAKYQREYANLIKATKDIGLADNVQPAGGIDARLQRLIDVQIRGFDQQPMVRSIQKQAEALQFVKSLDPNTTNSADDQGLIYAFAKAMDPDSVVREGEYNTVQRYAQSWLQTFGFNAQRVLANTEFLTPQARLNMKRTIEKRYLASKAQYDNLRKSYAGKIDKLTGKVGSGDEWLTDYSSGFPTGSVDAASAMPETVAPNGNRIYYDANGNPVKR